MLLLYLLIELRLVFDLLIFTFLLHLLFHLRVGIICQDLSSLLRAQHESSVDADQHPLEKIPNRSINMSATASTGSPTLRRSVVSRSVSQENVGPSEELTARLVSSTFEILVFPIPFSPRSLNFHGRLSSPCPALFSLLKLSQPPNFAFLPSSSGPFSKTMF